MTADQPTVSQPLKCLHNTAHKAVSRGNMA